MDTLTIKAYEGAALLELSDPQPADPQQPVRSFVATFSDAGLRAHTLVDLFDDYEMPGSDVTYLAALFDDLAANWRGWTGSKSWSALDGQLDLECSHDGLGHITVTIELHPLDRTRWFVRGGLVIAAGALDELAQSARRFLRL
jgi:Family of unknown function (DUF6228)